MPALSTGPGCRSVPCASSGRGAGETVAPDFGPSVSASWAMVSAGLAHRKSAVSILKLLHHS